MRESVAFVGLCVLLVASWFGVCCLLVFLTVWECGGGVVDAESEGVCLVRLGWVGVGL
jgi:hypothetical protein